MLPEYRKMTVHPAISRTGQTNHIRSKEGRYHGYSHHNRIQERARHIQTYSQCRNDKGKFTNLRQTESTLHGDFQRLT